MRPAAPLDLPAQQFGGDGLRGCRLHGACIAAATAEQVEQLLIGDALQVLRAQRHGHHSAEGGEWDVVEQLAGFHFVNAHTSATTQPRKVHPVKKFSTKIAT